MKFAEVVFLLVLVLGAVLAAAVWLVQTAAGWLRLRRRREAPWRLVEDSRPNPSDDRVELDLCFYAARPGQRRLLASVPWGAPDFDQQVYEARAQARIKIQAANDGKPLHGIEE